MSNKQELLDLIDGIIKKLSNRKMSVTNDADATFLHKKIYKFFDTLKSNIQLMDENLFFDAVNIDDPFIDLKKVLKKCSNLLEPRPRISIRRLYTIQDLIFEIIPLVNNMYLYPCNIDKKIIKDNELAQNSLNETLQLAKKTEQDLTEQTLDLQDKMDDVQNKLTNYKKQIENVIGELDSQLKHEQQNQRENFKRMYENYKEQFDNAFLNQSEDVKEKNAEIQKLAQELYENYESTLQKHEQEINEKRKQISKLAEIVAGEAYSKQYNNNADQEKELANYWRKRTIQYTLGSWILLIIFAGFTISTLKAPITAEIILYKLGVVTPVLAVVFYLIRYCSRQSAYHRNQERYYRDFALKATAIDPYISSLNNDLPDLLKTYVAGELFSNPQQKNVKESKSSFRTLIKHRINKALGKE